MKSKRKVIGMLAILSVGIILFGVYVGNYFGKETAFNQTKRQEIDQLVKDSHLKGNVALIQNKKLVYQQSYGYADADKKTKNSITDAFPIASLQKRMTAIVIAQLIEEDKLSYETTLSEFYPDIERSDEVTIRQLIDHRSGYFMPEIAPDHVLKTEDEQFEYSVATTELGVIGDAQYSNGNYTFLARIISDIEQDSYQNVVKRRIFKPLKLEHTYFWDELPTNKKLAKEYFYEDHDYGTETQIASPELFSSLLGAGNIMMTIQDLATFELSLGTEKLLSEEAMKELFGWSKMDDFMNKNIRGNISENGTMGGFDSYVYGSSDTNHMVIWLTNQLPETDAQTLIKSIYQTMLYD